MRGDWVIQMARPRRGSRHQFAQAVPQVYSGVVGLVLQCRTALCFVFCVFFGSLFPACCTLGIWFGFVWPALILAVVLRWG